MGKNATVVPQVENASDRWVCLSVNERFANKEHYKAVREEVRRILGRNCSVLIVGEEIGDDCFENALGNYLFVKCSDIYAKRKRLEECKYIKSCLRSFTDIQFIGQAEIDEMTSHWKDKLEKKSNPIRFGDIVQVRSGTFDKLHGVVIGMVGAFYTVRFRLFSRDITSDFPSNMLVTGVNIFNILKFPV